MTTKPPLMPGRRCTWRSYLTAYEAHQISECVSGRYAIHTGLAMDCWLVDFGDVSGNTWGREIGGVWESDNGLWSILGTPIDEAIGAAEADAPIPGERPIYDWDLFWNMPIPPHDPLSGVISATLVRDDDGQPEPPAGPMDSDLTMGGPES